tara:strand:- start:56 stop:802 length:747 start_codon:yes stop_codon:yes gene_type:complete
MARPKKNYCDYFPHDRDMRNHRKVKAIRTKFGPIGYAIWSMTLEYLTGIDGNVFEYSDVEFELMAGDFGVSATEIREVVDYCIKLDMLFNNNDFINSESLDERLKPVYEKRGTNKDKSKKQLRINGKFASINTVIDGVSAPEMPQSKVKESKVKEIKLKFKDNISLTENENQKLVSEFGKDTIDKAYEFLSSYKIEKSYTTKSDYLTIRRWVLEAVNKPNKTLSQQNSNNPYQQQLEAARKAYKPISE